MLVENPHKQKNEQRAHLPSTDFVTTEARLILFF